MGSTSEEIPSPKWGSQACHPPPYPGPLAVSYPLSLGETGIGDGGSGQKWQAASLPLEEVVVLMSTVTLAGQAGVGAGLHGAWLSSPPHSLAQAAPTWLSGSISQPSSFSFFFNFY